MGFLALLDKSASPAALADTFNLAAEQLATPRASARLGTFAVVADKHSAITSCEGEIRILSGPSQSFPVDGVGDSDGGAGRPTPLALRYSVSDDHLDVSRDRFGAVPVYYVDTPAFLAVSTRLACLAPFATGQGLSRNALTEALRYRWLSGTEALAAGVAQLNAGTVLRWSGPSARLDLQTWFEVDFRADGPADMDTQCELLRTALHRAIADAVSSAKKPAILMSGGVDSSVIAAFARELRPDVQCFIAKVPGDGAEELRRARFVAKRLGLPLEEVEFDQGKIASDLRRLIDLLEEPPRNPNNLVLMQLYQAMEKSGVDVALNGDGAEMLLGLADTQRVAQFGSKRRKVARLPKRMMALIAGMLRHLDDARAWRLARILDTPETDFAAGLDEIAYPPRIRRALLAWSGSYCGIDSCPRLPVLAKADTKDAFDDALHAFQCVTTLLSSQRRHECIARASDIEAITPFVHPAVLSFSRQLPRHLRYTDRSRPVLKQLCDEHVHPDVARWDKLGFPVPWPEWLEGPLAPALRMALESTALHDLFPASLMRSRHEAGAEEWDWTLMTLHEWLSRIGRAP